MRDLEVGARRRVNLDRVVGITLWNRGSKRNLGDVWREAVLVRMDISSCEVMVRRKIGLLKVVIISAFLMDERRTSLIGVACGVFRGCWRRCAIVQIDFSEAAQGRFSTEAYGWLQQRKSAP